MRLVSSRNSLVCECTYGEDARKVFHRQTLTYFRGAALATSTSHGLPTGDVIDSECTEDAMNIVALEGVFEKGLIRLARPLLLAEGTKVYVIIHSMVPLDHEELTTEFVTKKRHAEIDGWQS